ncbi:DUF2129 domain-containing protein [Streptococcus sp. X16XC17]|uniref:DUF2129 domain-containing protein n=1 Tax=unclassified Streptococcus TaxID=2608887 RepID=UPI00066FDB58|nr:MULTISPECIES: DUF2129 domain-containing protein [unclassified Streptococcus]TCD46643.1 DUF2129 domain-containing protein [Streptococcus sp. X16XC17]
MFEKQERLSLSVYLHYNRDARKLNQYGDVVYHSRRMRYVVLYVNQEAVEESMMKLKKEKIVKKVIPSYVKEIDQDFVGNLYRTTEENIL